MDEATLRYVRANHHEWIAPTGYKWADGYFILAVSPTHRQIGTYFGEDIAPALSILSEIQDAAKDDFRENASKVAEEWQALEGRRGEVERAFVALLEAGDYTTGLSARYACARAEYERVRSRIAQTQSTHFLGTMSAQASDETQEIPHGFARTGGRGDERASARHLNGGYAAVCQVAEPPAELVNGAEMFYNGSYLSQGATHEYNPASSTSSADYGSSSGGFSGSPSSSSY